MPSVVIAWQFEQDKLQAAIQERIKVQGRTVRTFAQIVNTALFSVALKAQKYTPKAEPSKIRASAFVTVNYVINKRGESVPARKGKKFSYGESQAPNAFNQPELMGLSPDLASHASMELMFAVVLARANLSKIGRATGTSLYNLRTNQRWILDKAMLTSRAVIRSIMERMISARSSSSALLKAGWKPAMDILRPYIARNDIGGSASGERFEVNKNLTRLGTATPAREGWYCRGMIENHVGQGGTRLDANQQRALLEFGTAPLQQALSEEADAMMAKVREYLERDAAEFNRKR